MPTDEMIVSDMRVQFICFRTWFVANIVRSLMPNPNNGYSQIHEECRIARRIAATENVQRKHLVFHARTSASNILLNSHNQTKQYFDWTNDILYTWTHLRNMWSKILRQKSKQYFFAARLLQDSDGVSLVAAIQAQYHSVWTIRRVHRVTCLWICLLFFFLSFVFF